MRALESIAVAASVALAACGSPDVGQSCPLHVQDPTYDKTTQCSTDRAEYFESGNSGCDNLICIRSVTAAGCAGNASQFETRTYCSKPCVSDSDCYKGDTGLVCRQIVLDAAFLATLPPDVRSRYLGDIQSSRFCATPSLP